VKEKIVKSIGYVTICNECEIPIVVKKRPGYQDRKLCNECNNEILQLIKDERLFKAQGFKR